MAKKGVDISYANGSVDFAALKQAGIEFVIIRCGYGSNIINQDDERFSENVRKADTLGVPWGTYIYSYARNVDMAKSEAQHVLRLLNGRKPAYGVWFDMEDDSILGGDLAGAAEVFCSEMEKAGLYAGVYSNYNWFTHYLTAPVFDKFDRWVAQYNPTCDLKKPYGIWQFTDGWVVGGKEFDCDWVYKDYPALTAGKKEGPELTEAEARKIAKEEYARQNPTYNTLEEVPAYWREDIKALMEDGIIQGSGAGKLALTRNEAKCAVFVRRAMEKSKEV